MCWCTVAGAGRTASATSGAGSRLAHALCLALLAAFAASLPFNYRFPKQDFVGAMRHVQSSMAPGDRVVFTGVPGPLYANLQNTTVSTWFNGGVRIYRAIEGPKGIADVPPQIEELGSYIPAAPPRNPTKTIQINHAIVGADGLIYANDRFAGGLYILRYTGTVPLD